MQRELSAEKTDSARVPPAVTMFAVPGLPSVKQGADLVRLICHGIAANGNDIRDGDVIVVAQKVVSKAQGRIVDLVNVTPTDRARSLADETGKDARLVQVILDESVRVVRQARGVLIVEHRLGFITANGGVDQSNVDPASGTEPVLLLPHDPDGSAEALRAGILRETGRSVAVVINDSFGRPWRQGTAGVALGAAGVPSLCDLRGQPDMFGRPMQVSLIAFADEIAAAASLLMGQAAEGLPVVVMRGLTWSHPPSRAASLVRSAREDLFR